MLAGPGAPDLAERVIGVRPPAAPWSSIAATLDGTAVRLVTGGGETGGAEVWVGAPASAGDRVASLLSTAGARPIGAEALESLRIEAGTLRFGSDIGPSVLLPEVPFEPLLSHSKGCYPGQEVVVRIRDRGHVNRHLRGLVVDGRCGAAARGRGRRRRRGDRLHHERHALLRPAASDRAGPRSSRARRAGRRGRGPGGWPSGPGHRERAALRPLTTGRQEIP